MSTPKDKIVIITGGGIGLAAVRGFVGAGAKGLITGRRVALLDEDIVAGRMVRRGQAA